jgi:hypothetical protein
MSSWSASKQPSSSRAPIGQTKTPTTDFDLDGDPEGTHTYTKPARAREAFATPLSWQIRRSPSGVFA